MGAGITPQTLLRIRGTQRPFNGKLRGNAESRVRQDGWEGGGSLVVLDGRAVSMLVMEVPHQWCRTGWDLGLGAIVVKRIEGEKEFSSEVSHINVTTSSLHSRDLRRQGNSIPLPTPTCLKKDTSSSHGYPLQLFLAFLHKTAIFRLVWGARLGTPANKPINKSTSLIAFFHSFSLPDESLVNEREQHWCTSSISCSPEQGSYLKF